jgi:hypothetical protein
MVHRRKGCAKPAWLALLDSLTNMTATVSFRAMATAERSKHWPRHGH